jgi:Ca2+-transporting ATPase
MTFGALIFGIVALILVDRSRSSSLIAAIIRPNRALAIVLPVVGVLLAVTLVWQPARSVFKFGQLDLIQLAVAPLAGLVILVTSEALKPIWRWSVRRKSENPATQAALMQD